MDIFKHNLSSIFRGKKTKKKGHTICLYLKNFRKHVRIELHILLKFKSGGSGELAPKLLKKKVINKTCILWRKLDTFEHNLSLIYRVGGGGGRGVENNMFII